MRSRITSSQHDQENYQTILDALKADPHRTRAKVEAAGRKTGRDPATIYRDLGKLRSQGVLSRKVRSDIGVHRLDSKSGGPVELLISEHLSKLLGEGHLADLPATEIYREIQKRCSDLALSAPHYNTVLDRIKDLKRDAQGAESLGDRSQQSVRGLTAPLETVLVEFLVIAELCPITSRRVLKWGLAVAVDLSGLAILGYALFDDQPDINTIRECLTSALLPKTHHLRRLGVMKEWRLTGRPGSIHVVGPHTLAQPAGCIDRLRSDLRHAGVSLDVHLVQDGNLNSVFLEANMPTLCKRVRLAASEILASDSPRREQLQAALIEEIITYNVAPTIALKAALRQTVRLSPPRTDSAKSHDRRLLRMRLGREIEAVVRSYGVLIDQSFHIGPGLELWWKIITRYKGIFSAEFFFHQDFETERVFFWEPVTDIWLELSPLPSSKSDVLKRNLERAAVRGNHVFGVLPSRKYTWRNIDFDHPFVRASVPKYELQ